MEAEAEAARAADLQGEKFSRVSEVYNKGGPRLPCTVMAEGKPQLSSPAFSRGGPLVVEVEMVSSELGSFEFLLTTR